MKVVDDYQRLKTQIIAQTRRTAKLTLTRAYRTQ